MPCPIPIRCGFSPYPAAPRYILHLLAKVISVSLETVEIVEGMPELGIEKAESVVDATGIS